MGWEVFFRFQRRLIDFSCFIPFFIRFGSFWRIFARSWCRCCERFSIEKAWRKYSLSEFRFWSNFHPFDSKFFFVCEFYYNGDLFSSLCKKKRMNCIFSSTSSSPINQSFTPLFAVSTVFAVWLENCVNINPTIYLYGYTIENKWYEKGSEEKKR